VELYEAKEGGFAARALAEEPTARRAIERMLREAVDVYAAPGNPRGCMVVSAATNCTNENDAVMRWLAEHRRARTKSIVDRLRQAAKEGELDPETDVAALGDYFAALLHGLSVQARDGVPRKRLLALIRLALRTLPPD
jgi:AcrR family transcriptional regulator